tara:strand:+ start:21477 stop:22673 length:1197 start_codon:yes stop_codon:yes gene_type:complete
VANKRISPELLTFSLALVGIAFGYLFADAALNLAFIGKIFILLLKVLIVPLVMSSLFLAITNLESKELKQLGSKTILYYLTTSGLACLVGLFFANTIGFDTFVSEYSNYQNSTTQEFSLNTFILSFFSGNIFQSLNEGNIVQLIVFTFILSFGTLGLSPEKRKPVVQLADSVQEIVMLIIQWIIRYIAPVGVCSLVAALVAKTDVQIFAGFGKLFLIILCACLTHILVSLSLIGKLVGKFNPYRFIGQVREALIVALTTASSAATLPVSMRVIREKAQVKQKTSDFILPIGATLNMDGSALYQSVVILFMANMAGIELVLTQQILVFFFVMVSSAGTAGVPNGGIIMMGAVMEMLGIPLEYLGLYLLIDRIWDYPVTMINVLGDLMGAKTVDRFIKDE